MTRLRMIVCAEYEVRDTGDPEQIAELEQYLSEWDASFVFETIRLAQAENACTILVQPA